MIKMVQIERIKKLKEEQGLSFNEISQVTGVNRKTVSKWYNSKAFPKYQRKRIKTPIQDKISPYIQAWLKEDKVLIEKGKKKRFRAASTMSGDLKRLGIKCGESTVRQYVNKYKPKEVYITLEHDPGEEMQVDWGYKDIEFEGGIILKVPLFVATLPYSNARFAYPYLKAEQIAFFDGHIKAYNFFEGIAGKTTYDNLSSAIKKVLSGLSREEQDIMIYFKNFYNFETNYCGCAKGNEKGSVENGVGFVKRRFLSSNYVFKDFQELRDYLVDRSLELLEEVHYNKKVKIKELLEEERGYLKGIPAFNFRCSNIIPVKSSSTLYVEYDCVKYSIPSEYCGKNIFLEANPEDIIIYDSKYLEKEIAKYKRTHKVFKREECDFRHYLPVLLKKSRALDQASCIRKSNFPAIFWEYLEGLKKKQYNGNREMVKILLLHNKYSLKNIFFAMEWCRDHRSYSYDSILLTLKELESEGIRAEKINKEYPAVKDYPIDLQKYDRLLGVRV